MEERPPAASPPPLAAGIETIQKEKLERLAALLRSLGRVAVAYSGGVDSSFLLSVARSVLGDDAVGVLAVSESLDRHEHEEAVKNAALMGIPVEVIVTREHENPEYRKNDGNRCYHCKHELFVEVKKFAAARGILHVVDGSNADDVGDYRPGLRARNEQGVRSPLLEAGLGKDDIRRFARGLGLPQWDKPAAPCLASRIPYGSEVTNDKLRQVERAEKAMRDLGLRVFRVRHHGPVARLEVSASDFPRLLDPGVRAGIVEGIKSAGFLFVAVDLEEFRSGSLNAALGLDLAAEPDPRLVLPERLGRMEGPRS
jgi:uncharacterized protein